MIIAHNVASMTTAGQLKFNTNQKTKSVEKLSSGYRITRAADDAAGLQISEKMRAQIRGLEQGAKNIQEGVSYCQVAEGALNEIQDMLHRLTELSVKAANETNSISDREAMNQEIEEIKTEMDRICKTTKYNEEYIFKSLNDSDDIIPYDVSFTGVLQDIYIMILLTIQRELRHMVVSHTMENDMHGLPFTQICMIQLRIHLKKADIR